MARKYAQARIAARPRRHDAVQASDLDRLIDEAWDAHIRETLATPPGDFLQRVIRDIFRAIAEEQNR